MVFSSLLHSWADWFDSLSISVSNLPGALYIFDYVRASYQNDPVRVALEVLLVFFALRYLLSARYDAKSRGRLALSESEIDALVNEWEPEPLVSPTSDMPRELACIPYILNSPAPHYLTVKDQTNGTTHNVVDFSSYDYFGFSQNKELKNTAVSALRVYGVGSCGPPGFYGFTDLHDKLEKNIASFLGLSADSSAALYAQAFSASSSVISAFAKRGDTLYVDEEVSFAILKGVQISRARVVFFKHNDMKDLEDKIQLSTGAAGKPGKSPGSTSWASWFGISRSGSASASQKSRLKYRHFIVFEGLYERSGTVAPLPQLIEIGKRHCVRLIMDDSHAFAALGPTGRGTAEHFGLPATAVDITIGSLAHSLAGSGGFCFGNCPAVVEHQRLNASAYCFSAAMSPILAATASHGLEILKSGQGVAMLARLQANIKLWRAMLAQTSVLRLVSDEGSPMQHVYADISASHGRRLPPDGNQISQPECKAVCCGAAVARDRATRLLNSVKSGCREFTAQAEFLQDIVEECTKRGLLISRAKYNLDEELIAPRPSIRFNVPATLDESEIHEACEIFMSAYSHVADNWSLAVKASGAPDASE